MNQHLPIKYVNEQTFDKLLKDGYIREYFLGLEYINGDEFVYIKTPKMVEDYE